MDIVSIITPAYNAEVYIKETIISVISQSYKNWELLITDDCSSDNTSGVIKNFTNIDSRIKYFKSEQNGGPANARNISLMHAKGNFIAFLDSDDIWPPNKLEVQISFMIENRYDFTFTEFRRFIDIDKPGMKIPVATKIGYKNLLKQTIIATSTVMINLEVIGPIKMNPEAYYDDFVLWLDIMKKGCDAYGIHKDLMRYRVLPNSVSRNKINSALQIWITYRKFERQSFLKSLWLMLNWTLNSVWKYRKL